MFPRYHQKVDRCALFRMGVGDIESNYDVVLKEK